MAHKIACFISIPKCGSKSVLEILQLGKNRDSDSEDKSNVDVIYENHQRYKILDQQYDLSDKFVFAFCRNPYERIASWYSYHQKLAPYKFYSFEQWVLAGCPHHFTVQNKTNWRKDHISPLLQWHFLQNHSSQNNKVDFIGRMENFEQDLKTVVKKLNRLCSEKGLKPRFSYQQIKTNTSSAGKLQKQWTEAMKNMVYSLFRLDFDYFGYSKLYPTENNHLETKQN